MNSSDTIEQTAVTIEEAIRRALETLGASEDDVTIEILSTPRSGVLGLGARQARVRVTRRQPPAATSEVQSPPLAQPPQPAIRPERQREDRDRDRAPRAGSARPPSEPAPAAEEKDQEAQAREAVEVLSQILELMGEKSEVIIAKSHDPENIELEIRGDGSGILIGRHGQTLDALEYMLNRILARRLKNPLAVTLDTEAYRARRRNQIHRMALSMGERAKREHAVVKLEPMAPRERRIVHLALKDDPMITTRSSGEGYMRTIEIVPVGSGRKQAPQGNKEREGAIGEQGGFKRGQKKII
jgi:spoIIIJ-associated protein